MREPATRAISAAVSFALLGVFLLLLAQGLTGAILGSLGYDQELTATGWTLILLAVVFGVVGGAVARAGREREGGRYREERPRDRAAVRSRGDRSDPPAERGRHPSRTDSRAAAEPEERIR